MSFFDVFQTWRTAKYAMLAACYVILLVMLRAFRLCYTEYDATSMSYVSVASFYSVLLNSTLKSLAEGYVFIFGVTFVDLLIVVLMLCVAYYLNHEARSVLGHITKCAMAESYADILQVGRGDRLREGAIAGVSIRDSVDLKWCVFAYVVFWFLSLFFAVVSVFGLWLHFYYDIVLYSKDYVIVAASFLLFIICLIAGEVVYYARLLPRYLYVSGHSGNAII